MIERILELLREINPYEQITEDTELVKNDILNSLSILSLITQLEEEFEIEIADDAVTADNFATVLTIVRLVEESKKFESGVQP